MGTWKNIGHSTCQTLEYDDKNKYNSNIFYSTNGHLKKKKKVNLHEQRRGCVIKGGALISPTLELCWWRNCILNATSGHLTLFVMAAARDDLDWRALAPITRGQETQPIGCCTGAQGFMKGVPDTEVAAYYWHPRRKTCVVSTQSSPSFIRALFRTVLGIILIKPEFIVLICSGSRRRCVQTSKQWLMSCRR